MDFPQAKAFVGRETWEDVRKDLKRILWIDCLLDEEAKKVFERIIRWDGGDVG